MQAQQKMEAAIENNQSEGVDKTDVQPQTCTICLDVLIHDLYAFIPCGHVFHHECIGPWMKNKKKAGCPVCRCKTSCTVIPLYFDARPLMGPAMADMASRLKVEEAEAGTMLAKLEVQQLQNQVNQLNKELAQHANTISAKDNEIETLHVELEVEKFNKSKQVQGEIALRREMKTLQDLLEAKELELSQVIEKLRQEQALNRKTQIELDNIQGERSRMVHAMRDHTNLRQERDDLQQQTRQLKLEKTQLEHRLERLYQSKPMGPVLPQFASSLDSRTIQNLSSSNKKRVHAADPLASTLTSATSKPPIKRTTAAVGAFAGVTLSIDLAKVSRQLVHSVDAEVEENEIENDEIEIVEGPRLTKPLSRVSHSLFPLASIDKARAEVQSTRPFSAHRPHHGGIPPPPPKQLKMDRFILGGKSL